MGKHSTLAVHITVSLLIVQVKLLCINKSFLYRELVVRYIEMNDVDLNLQCRRSLDLYYMNTRQTIFHQT